MATVNEKKNSRIAGRCGGLHLSPPLFVQSPRLWRFLKCVVKESLAGWAGTHTLMWRLNSRTSRNFLL